MRHGDGDDEVPLDVWLGDDPELALVHANMDAWADAHPCDCPTVCECESGDA